MEDVFLTSCDDGVAGIVSSLASDDDVGSFGEVVDYFTFSFVSPLETGDDGVHFLNTGTGTMQAVS